MSIYQKIWTANDRAMSLERKLGNPLLGDIVIRHTSVATATSMRVVEDTVIKNVCIKSIPPKLDGLSLGYGDKAVFVSALDFVIEVSRSYPKDLFIRDDLKRASVFINPPLDSDGNLIYENPATKAIGATQGYIIHVMDDKCCSWELIVRRDKD